MCLYYESYYDRIGKFLKFGNKEEEYKLKSMFYSSRIDKLMSKRREMDKQERDPEYLYQRIKEDLPKLERLYKDPKYRKEMEEPHFKGYTFSIPRYEFTDVLGLERLDLLHN